MACTKVKIGDRLEKIDENLPAIYPQIDISAGISEKTVFIGLSSDGVFLIKNDELKPS